MPSNLKDGPSGEQITGNVGDILTFDGVEWIAGAPAPPPVIIAGKLTRLPADAAFADTGSVRNALTFVNTAFDRPGGADAVTDLAGNRLVIPVGRAGIWEVGYAWQYNNTGANVSQGFLRLNGADFPPGFQSAQGSGMADTVSLVNLYDLAAGDVLQLESFRTGGGSIDIETIEFWATFVRA